MIGVIGLGFVGLTTSLGFAHQGYKVYGYDISKSRRDELRRGQMPFHEPHLGKHLKEHLGRNFHLCENLSGLMDRSSVIFYCVGTPSSKQGQADLSFLQAAIEESLRYVNSGLPRKTLVIKSSVPPLTASEAVCSWIRKKGLKPGADVGLASNPEFLREGCAWNDFIKPDRIVIGADDPLSAKSAAALYKRFGAPVHSVSLNSAEFIKYLSNGFLASMISFSNEMAMLAETIGNVDVSKVFHILHEDRRWKGKPAPMSGYVYPGCGFGGNCLPKDAQALYYLAYKKNCPMPILKGAIDNNERIKNEVVRKITCQAGKKDVIGVLGLAFKTGIDDVRGSPALFIIRRLLALGFSNIIVYDPLAAEVFRKSYGLPVKYAPTLEDAVKHSKVLVLLTSWPEFKKKSSLFKTRVLIDGRYFLTSKVSKQNSHVPSR